MDILDFKPGDFRNLSDFLGYFASHSFGRSRATDEQIVKYWLAVSKPHERKKVLDEVRLLLTVQPLPFAFVQDYANRYLADEETAKTWLNKLCYWLKSLRVEGEEARQEALKPFAIKLVPLNQLPAYQRDRIEACLLSTRKPGKPRRKGS